MLKKMRWRFVGAAMSAITVVTIILVLVINLWNYVVTIQNIDASMYRLPQTHQVDIGPIGEQGGIHMGNHIFGEPVPSEEEPYMMRFFLVQVNEEGKLMSAGMDFVSSVSQEQAEEYATAVLERGRERGFYGEYRYMVRENGPGSHILFLNVASELQFIRNLMMISCLVAVTSLTVIFILLVILSKRAIKPYADNIERQKRFITDAGHEIKTPLTSIATSADLLAMEDEGNEWVLNIQKQTARMSKLVKNLITLSRLDEEVPFPEQEAFSFSDALWEGIEPFIGLAKAQEKEFVYEIEEGLALCGDHASIQQMISILLDNAFKYSPDNSKVTLNAYKKHRNTVLEISNACEKISEEELAYLFERFYRPDISRTSATGGNGIGLSIAKSVAEAHGGSIKAKLDKETITFKVTI